MARTTEQMPARAGRFWRMLIGDEANGGLPDDVIDLRSGPRPSFGSGRPDLQELEYRVQRLESGVRLIADTLKAVGTQLTDAVRNLQADSRERDHVARAETQQMMWEAIAPLSEAVGHLTEAVRTLPLVVSSSTERILHHVAQPEVPHLEDAIGALPEVPADGAVEPTAVTVGDVTVTGLSDDDARAAEAAVAAELAARMAEEHRLLPVDPPPPVSLASAGDLPVVPFELEPLVEGGEIPGQRALDGVGGDDADWFWGPSGAPNA